MQNIIITYPSSFQGELEQIVKILETEDCCLHLRKPDYSEAEYEALLQAIPAKFHLRIMLHDYFHLAEKYKLAGLHFSTEKRSVYPNFHILKFAVSTSCHSVEELKAIDGTFTYAFLSPVFPSISKQAYEGTLDMQQVQAYLQTPHKTKVIALGGVDASRIRMIEAYGFDGYAQLGSIWKFE